MIKLRKYSIQKKRKYLDEYENILSKLLLTTLLLSFVCSYRTVHTQKHGQQTTHQSQDMHYIALGSNLDMSILTHSINQVSRKLLKLVIKTSIYAPKLVHSHQFPFKIN